MTSVLRSTSTEGYPEEFYCPVCYDLMTDPVVDTNGNTYERHAIEAWINTNGTSPTTRQPLSLTDLRPNRTLLDMITSAIQQRAVEQAAANATSQQGEGKTNASSAETKYNGTEEACLEVTTRGSVSGSSAEEDWCLIKIKSPEGPQVQTPVDICVVIDTSGSMCSEAKMQSVGGVSESHGLSILDVVKHATTTIIESLGKGDRLAIVAYSSQAKSVLPLTVMHNGGKALAKNALQMLQPSGSTNLWDGLKMGMDLLAKDSNPTRMTSCFILTDGCPNIVPPRGHLPMLRRYKDSQPTNFSCTINTYGFGYNLDSTLLDDIAREGQGSYSFIPDSGFVGTVFTNALANLCSTLGKKVRLTIEPIGDGVELQVENIGRNESEEDDDDDQNIGKRRTGVYGGHPCTRASWGLSLDLGTLRYGQDKDIVIRIKKTTASAGGSALVRATLSYDHVGASKAQNDPSTLSMTVEQDSSEITTNQVEVFDNALMYHTCRLELIDTIYAMHFAYKSNRGQEARQMLSALVGKFERNAHFPSDKRGRMLVKDLTGQVTEAISKDEYYTKWGQHYLTSLAGAHLLQLCYNFKDPGVQLYGGMMFGTLRDFIDEQFNKLPPPTPSRRVVSNSRGNYGGSSSSQSTAASPSLQSMRSYNCSSAPCFPGDATVLCADGRVCRVDALSRGDLVVTGKGQDGEEEGEYGVVDVVVQTMCKDGTQDLVTLAKSGLRVTPWHPVRVQMSGGQRQWTFPMTAVEDGEASIKLEAECAAVYSFMLEKGSGTSMMINGVECITLAHNITEDAVASHPYYGTDVVREDLYTLKMQNEKRGIVKLQGGACVQRDCETGLVCGLYQTDSGAD
jgi:Mg-chelatase subunit ChlD